MADSQAVCWCYQSDIPKELQAIVPKEAKDKVCICSSCIQLFKDSPHQFKKKYQISLTHLFYFIERENNVIKKN